MELWAQALTLLGVVVGAAASYVAAALNERWRWRRERSARWDHQRLLTYTAFTETSKVIAMLAARIAETRQLTKGAALPLDVNEGLEMLEAAELDRSVKFEGVLFLGDAETIAAGHALNQKLWRMEAISRGTITADSGEWREAFQQYRRARSAFYDSARSSMDIPRAGISIGDWVAPPSAVEEAAFNPVGIVPATNLNPGKVG
ncbi:hypothetical protein [Micromonospora sp. M61]|uniref:hypothetical protein n=1 Tax=Micromonospora sp. M61 TaxID=2824890 RepID=UPI001B393035|nr:hypothetical protein [Micromonospora sp. M61]MBQ0982913.1 hypothetical protein [Micromonospora sp. M61]